MISRIELFKISDCKSTARFQKENELQTSPCNQGLPSRLGSPECCNSVAEHQQRYTNVKLTPGMISYLIYSISIFIFCISGLVEHMFQVVYEA